MEVLEAVISDAEEILSLQKIAYLSEAALHDDYDIPPLTQSLDDLQTDFARKYILKVVIDGEIVGSGQARLDNDTCYIGRMAVKPSMRGLGIGTRILKHLEEAFMGVNRVEIFTGENSAQNLAMYERRGYRRFKTEQLGKTRIVFLEKAMSAGGTR